jgi:hypothetical protein
MAITKTNPFQTNVLRLTPSIKHHLNGQARILNQRPENKAYETKPKGNNIP